MASFDFVNTRGFQAYCSSTKVDGLWNRAQHKPISSHDLSFQGDSDYGQVCEYFADRFQTLDHRFPRELHIYLVNTVDCASVEFVFDDILTNLYGTSPKHLRRANLIPLRTVHRRQPLSSRPAPGTLNLSGV